MTVEASEPASANLLTDLRSDHNSGWIPAQAWLTYINSELHKNIGPMFSPVLSDDAKAFFKDRATGKFKYVDGQLAGKDYLMGKQFTVADGYLFTMLSWADRMKFDLAGLSNLKAYQARVAARPMVQEALTREGLMKAA